MVKKEKLKAENRKKKEVRGQMSDVRGQMSEKIRKFGLMDKWINGKKRKTKS